MDVKPGLFHASLKVLISLGFAKFRTKATCGGYLRFKKLLGALREDTGFNLISNVRWLCCVKSLNTISLKYQTKKRLIRENHNSETKFVDLHFVQQVNQLGCKCALNPNENCDFILAMTTLLLFVSAYCCHSLTQTCLVPCHEKLCRCKGNLFHELNCLKLFELENRPFFCASLSSNVTYTGCTRSKGLWIKRLDKIHLLEKDCM